MIVSAIVAMDRNGLIGYGSSLPWKIPGDLIRFRDLTIGKPVIMGRKTFDALPRPLDRRTNIVLSRQHHYLVYRAFDSSVELVSSVDDAVRIGWNYADVENREIMIIGGSEVFAKTCHLWDRIYLTLVDGQFEGDVYFPTDATDGIRWVFDDVDFVAKGKYPAHRFMILNRSDNGSSIRDLVSSSSEIF